MTLDPTGAELRALLHGAVEYVVRAVERLPDEPASDAAGVVLADSEIRRPPAEGLDTASPGYLASIPGSGLVASEIADLVAGG